MNKINLSKILLIIWVVSFLSFFSSAQAKTYEINLDTDFADGGTQYSDPDESLDYDLNVSPYNYYKMVSNGYNFYLMNSDITDGLLHVFTPTSVGTYLYFADIPSTSDADTLTDSDCDSSKSVQALIRGIAIENYPSSGDTNIAFVGREENSCYGSYIGLGIIDTVTDLDWIDSIKRPEGSGTYYGVDIESNYIVATGFEDENLSLLRVTYGTSSFSSTEVEESFDVDGDSTIYDRGYDVQIVSGTTTYYVVSGRSYDRDSETSENTP